MCSMPGAKLKDTQSKKVNVTFLFILNYLIISQAKEDEKVVGDLLKLQPDEVHTLHTQEGFQAVRNSSFFPS